MSNASQPEGKEPKPTGRPPMPLPERQERFQRYIEAVEQGKTKGEACKAAGIAWGSLARWLTDDSNICEGVDGSPVTFAARYAGARLTSADFYADKAQDAAEQAVTKVDATIARVKYEVYKWRASVADPKGYGAQPTNKVEVNVSLGSLHLDALRKVSASAKVIPHNEIADAEVLSLPRDSEQSSVPIRSEEGP